MPKIKTIAPFLIVSAAFLWGVDGVLRRSLYTLPPLIIVFYEHLIGAILITPFALPQLSHLKLSKTQWQAMAYISVTSSLLGTLFFTTALLKTNFIPFSVVFLLQKLQPIFVIAAARLLLKEKLPNNFYLWSTTSLIAAYFVTFPNGVINFSTGQQTNIAALFALAAAFCWGSSTASSRFVLTDQPHTAITALRFYLTILISPILIFAFSLNSQLFAPTLQQLFTLTLIALSTGMVALWLYYLGLKHTKASISTILELTFPATAVAIDAILYHTLLLPSQYLAATILFYSIYKISRSNQ